MTALSSGAPSGDASYGVAPGRAPVRALHLGLGAFHRAHQAWYTERANRLPGAEAWGILAFTGRRPDAADVLAAQHHRYTLIERDADSDHGSTIESIVATRHGSDLDAWRAGFADETIALCTLTVTEAAYVLGSSDLTRLRAEGAPESAPARVVDGLRARHRSGGAPFAVVSCDNLTGNGDLLRTRVLSLADALDDDLAAWIRSAVSFPSTMVDRITPATTDADRDIAARMAGWADASPVVTEPFSEWVIAGAFPAGRPAWDRVGVQLVDDVTPYEERKLWLLNAAHSTLAYLGLGRGHRTVAEAMDDPVCVEAIEAVWSEAAAVLPFDAATITAATTALTERFTNPRIEHRLAQIAADGSQKLPVRILDVHRRRREAGLGVGTGEATAVAAWIRHLTDGTQVTDPAADPIRDALAGATTDRERVRIVLEGLSAGSPEITADDDLAAACVEQLATATAGAAR